MKEHFQVVKPFPLAKFVAVVALLTTIFVLGWKHRAEENQAVAIHGIQVSANTPAFAKSRNEQAAAEVPARETEAAPVTVMLEGKFSPESEPLLLEQLERIGYFEFWDYRLNADGSAVIMALRGQSARQPIVTIVVNKQGKASATSRDFFDSEILSFNRIFLIGSWCALVCPPLSWAGWSFKYVKIKGSSSVVKMGTKVKNIRLIDGDHDIDGIGGMQLKSEFVKKA